MQYADVAPAVETAIDADVAYWREHLSPLPDLPILPGAETTGSDRRRSDRVMREIPRRRRCRRGLGRQHAGRHAVRRLPRSNVGLPHRITGANDFVAVPVTARPRWRGRTFIGYFGNSLLVRATVAPTDSFAELVTRAGAELSEALAHQSAPIDQVVAAISRATAAGAAWTPRVVEPERPR